MLSDPNINIFLFHDAMQDVRPTDINVLRIWVALVVVAEVYVFSCFLLYWLARIILYEA
jgi:hypothetical protein